jgi:hypothetical protein
MQRRKYLAAIGSLAAGGAAVMGTGAFSSVSTARTVNVRVATDENSYLGLKPTGDRASQEKGQLKLDFSGSSTGAMGLNPNSRTEFLDVFEIENQGENPAFVAVGTEQSDVYVSGSGNPLLFDFANLGGFVYAEGPNGNGTGLPFNGGSGNMVIDSGGRVDISFEENGDPDPENNPQILYAGESISVDFSLVVDGTGLGGGGNKEIVIAAADPENPRTPP